MFQEELIDSLSTAEARVLRERFDVMVHVLPPAEADDYAALFAVADAFVLPTHGEGWGRPIGTLC